MRLLRGRRARAVERIDDASVADERVLAHLARLGCDPEQPRETRHFLYLRQRESADAVAERLRHDGWGASISASENDWLVVATREYRLTAEVVRDTRALLEALAAAHGGVYDGWEAATS
jgi:hypothetical protein